MKRTAVFLIGLILPVAAMTPVIGGARAGFIDLSMGGSATGSTDMTAKIGPTPGVPLVTASGEAGFDYGVSLGLGGGYWFNSLPWLGLALNLGYFKANEDASPPLRLDVHPITGLLMLRYPMRKSDTYPHGQLYPYLGVGPAAFVTSTEQDLTSVGMEDTFRDTTVDLGIDARVGLKAHFAAGHLPPGMSYALFMEYRFTRFNPTAFENTVDGVPIEIDLDELNTHHLVVGLGFHF